MGIEEAEKSFEELAKEQHEAYKAQVTKVLAKTVAPVVGVVQEAAGSASEELKVWTDFRDKYEGAVNDGRLSCDPYITGYIGGRMLYLTQKTFGELKNMVGWDSKTLLDNLLKLK